MSEDEDGQLYDRSFWQRLNQQYAEAGGTAVLPEDWRRFEAEDDAICLELPYDDDPVARRVAGRMVENYVNAWDAGQRVVYEGWCHEAEATLYVLSYSYNAGYAVALRDIGQLRQIKADMKGSWRCDTLVNRRCGMKVGGLSAEYPVVFLAIKRGEHICVFTACHHCMLHISSRAGVDHPDYIGPEGDWFDGRQAEPYGIFGI